MPCVSLKHHKIYRETIAPRIAARKLVHATEKAAAKSAKKSAKKAAKAQAAATKAALKSAKKLAKQTSKKTQKIMRSQKANRKQSSQSQSQIQPQSQHQAQSQTISTLHSNLVATATPEALQSIQSMRPRISYISSTMQDFREDVEVKILHAKHRLSVDNPLATIAAATPRVASENTRRGGAYSSSELFASQMRDSGRFDFSETSAGQRPEEKAASARNDGPEERRSSKKQGAQGSIFSRRPTRAELINAESSLGRTLFGPIPAGHRREFFHDRENVWLWHEAWVEPNREARQMTIRYEVRPTGVFKKLSAGSYVALEGNELENFRRAAHAYLYLIKRNLYHLV